MAALSIQVPYPVFYDRDGLPLDNGNIYIGDANLDPVTNPLQVYYDEALTLTASQPLKTSNGYVYRNGTPAQLYVDATDFSILVNDSQNLLVYSFPQATGFGVGASGISFVPYANITATNVQDAIEEEIDDLAAASGSSLIGFSQPGGSAVLRTAQARFRDTVSVKDFGATGDGTTDDTTTMQAAIDYAIANGRDLFIPDGTYIVNQLVFNSTSYALMPSIYGSGRNQTIIKKKSGSTVGALLTIGSFGATNFMANVTIEGITFDGLNSATTTWGVLCYNFVRSRIVNCIVKNCDFGVYFQGGIASWLVDCVIVSNNQGFTADSFASSAGSAWPNYHILQRCIVSDNSLWGVYFDNGRMLRILDCDIEGNGTNLNNASGGIRVGPDIDSEDSGANPFGIIITNTWLESNAGAASIVMLSGRNMIYNCNIVANVNAVYDIYAEGCNYNLYESVITTSNNPSIYETGSVLVGNTITAVAGITLAEMSINRAKTQLDFGGYSGELAEMPAGLPEGTRGFITNSTVTASGNFGAVITGGGVNYVPAYYDGVNWRIG
jgi:hypothetical protein